VCVCVDSKKFGRARPLPPTFFTSPSLSPTPDIHFTCVTPSDHYANSLAAEETKSSCRPAPRPRSPPSPLGMIAARIRRRLRSARGRETNPLTRHKRPLGSPQKGRLSLSASLSSSVGESQRRRGRYRRAHANSTFSPPSFLSFLFLTATEEDFEPLVVVVGSRGISFLPGLFPPNWTRGGWSQPARRRVCSRNATATMTLL